MAFKQIIVLDRQSLDDIAIQEYGHIDGKFLLLADNSDRLQSLNDVPWPGMKLNVQTPVPMLTNNNQLIAAYFAAKKQQVVTDAGPVTQPITLEAYVEDGYMIDGYIVPPFSIIYLSNISNTPHD